MLTAVQGVRYEIGTIVVEWISGQVHFDDSLLLTLSAQVICSSEPL